jgi:hypothetical protein
MLKVAGPGPLKGPPFFPISVTPIKIENHKDSVLTTFL